MPIKILIVKADKFAPSPTDWPGAEIVELTNVSALLNSGSNEIPVALIAPNSLRKDPQIQGLLDAGFPLSCIFFHDGAQADEFATALSFIFSDSRSIGVKNCLAKGSTIYSETFYNAAKVGTRLDAVFKFVRGKLKPMKAVEAWGVLQALILLAIRALPNQGEAGTGERIDVQVGADEEKIAFTVRFDLPPEQWIETRNHSLLELPRSTSEFFEFRYLQKAKKAEFLAVSFLKHSPASPIETQSFQLDAALEDSKEVKDYNFQEFGSLGGSLPEEKRVIKGGFKKKFSEQVGAASAPKAKSEQLKASSEKIVDAENGNFLVSGEVLQANQKVVVSGSAEMGKNPSQAPAPAAAAPAAKSDALLESKILSLESTLKQRDELVAKLNKEIEEIKDPLKMGVISGIKDNQVSGLKDNIKRLQEEVAEAQGREKELMGVVDKAIQMKDDAMKKLKELDIKLKQSSGGNSSKVIMLEKQIEEQKRQNKELSKRVSQLTEQIVASGKRVA